MYGALLANCQPDVLNPLILSSYGGVYCIIQRSRNKLTLLMYSSKGGGSFLGISSFKEKNSQN